VVLRLTLLIALGGCRWDFDRGSGGEVVARDARVSAGDAGLAGADGADGVDGSLATTSVVVTLAEADVRDTELHAQMPGQSYGGGILLTADASPEQHILIDFTLDAVPPGALIDLAALEVDVANDHPASLVAVHEVLEAWTEPEATWNERAAGVPWGNAGGSFAGEVASFMPVGHTMASVDLTSLVQAWVEGTRPNHGILLRIVGADGQINLPSRENGGSPGPTLVVAYH
jgi:hypothetical protein